MTDDRDLRLLESRLRQALHRAAPMPDPQLADRLLDRTASTSQRRGLARFAGTGLLAAAAVVVLAVATGLLLGYLPGIRIGVPDASDRPSIAPSQVPSPESPESATPNATASPETTPSSDAAADMQRCTNEARGYSIGYPDGWHTNEEIAQQFDDPTPACTFFGEQPLGIRPNAGLPPTVAITIDRWTEVPVPGDGWEEIAREETTVAGLPAVVIEEEQMTDIGAPFSQRGDRSYAYVIELPDGSVLIAGTGTTADGDYATHKAALDRMVQTLELTGGGSALPPEGPLDGS